MEPLEVFPVHNQIAFIQFRLRIATERAFINRVKPLANLKSFNGCVDSRICDSRVALTSSSSQVFAFYSCTVVAAFSIRFTA